MEHYFQSDICVFSTKMAYDGALSIVGTWSRDQKGNSNAMTKQVGACCSSPASICYWFIVSLIAWGVLSLIGIYWRPLHASSAAACLFAMAIGCLANWHRNRSFHCAITGPLFLIGGIMFLLSGVRMIHVDTVWVWLVLLIGIGVAFVLEWLYGKRPAS
jgi:hypothetical protein